MHIGCSKKRKRQGGSLVLVLCDVPYTLDMWGSKVERIDWGQANVTL